jgi:hypothetical protein
MNRLVVVALAFSSFSLVGCAGRSPDIAQPDPVEGPTPDLSCPGSASCSSTLEDDALLAGASKHVVTPTQFEIANAAYLNNDRPNYCAPEAPVQGTERRCGELRDEHVLDCGRDGVCPEDDNYTAPDADGTERDGDSNDWFFDCGLDRICPDNVPEEGDLAENGKDDDGDGAIDDGAYPGPDEGEGDGEFQGLWMAGYDNNRPVMGMKDDLYVRAVVFRQGDTTLAILTLDAVGLFYDEQVRIQDKVNAQRPGEVDAVFVQSTHTHEAPDTMGQWGYVDPFVGLQHGPGRNDEYMEKIRTEGAAAIVEALDNLVPVEVKVGQIHVGVDGLVRDSRDPFIVNDAVTAIALDDQETGEAVATIMNWGNHPEILDSRNNFMSTDFVGPARDALENGLPETATHPARPARGGVGVYWQGAVGGLLGPNGFEITGRDGTVYNNDEKTFARCNAYGELLAELAFQALDEGETLARTPLRFSVKSYTAPVENAVFHVGLFNGWFDRALYNFDQAKAIGGDNVPNLKTAVAVVHLGDIGFATAPGELFPELFVGFDPSQSHGRDTIDPENPNPPDLTKAPAGPYIQELVDARFAFPMGLCQDETGYLVPPYDFQLAEGADAYIEEAPGDHYEETNSIGPKAVPLLLENLKLLTDFEAARGE